MSELLDKIYDRVITCEKDWIDMGCRAEQKTAEIISSYSDRMDEKSLENLRDDFVNVAVFAEREAYYLGMKHAFKIFVKMMAE